MSDETRRDDNFTTELEELLPLIEELKSIPRHRPRLTFEVRMWLYSLSPTHGAKAIERRRESRIGSRHENRTTRDWVLRSAACVALASLLALGIFSGLVVAGRNSRPGDSLYFTKRVRQKVELAFTWGNEKKAEKQIAFARQKLVDIDFIAGDSRRSTKVVASTIEDYRDNVRSVGQLLQATGSTPAEEKVLADLESLKSQEKKVLGRVAAAKPESLLAAASNARVEVRDSSGGATLGTGQSALSGTADENGTFAFDALLGNESKASDLEVTVELDGRKAALPLFAEASAKPANAFAQVLISPDTHVLQVRRPATFTVTLKDIYGAPLEEKEVRLRDRSQSGTINGEPGEARIVTDAEGRFDFTFKKNSALQVSRIDAWVLDGTWHELGDILIIGGVESPRDTPEGSAVRATSVTSEEGVTTIALDNGFVDVTVDNGKPGQVINGITCGGESQVAGSLVDPSVTAMYEDKALKDTDRAEPVLFYTDSDAAGYEVSFEVPSSNGALTKTYRVMLYRGERFARVLCQVRRASASDATTGTVQAVSPELILLETPNDCALVKLSGKPVSRPVAGGTPTVVPFSFSDPLSLYEAGDATVAIAIPPESLSYPDSWSIDDRGIGIRCSDDALKATDDWSLTAIVGFTDGQKSDLLLQTAMGDRALSLPAGYLPNVAAEGAFLITTSSNLGESASGRQRIKLNIFKTYETPLAE